MMKIVSKIMMICIATLTIISCQEAPKMISGFKYEATNNGGQVAKPGEYAYFTLTIKTDQDSILDVMDEGPNMPMYKIPMEPPVAGKAGNPVQDLAALLGVGDMATVYMPMDSLTNMPPNLKELDHIKYEMKLTKVETEVEFQAKLAKIKEDAEMEKQKVVETVNADLEIFKAGTSDQIKTTPEGLKYIMHDEGTGARGEAGKGVAVDYYGVFLDGNMFDNSYRSGRPFQFTVGRGEAIQGWDVGIPLLKEGGNATIYVPYNLAYGEAGRAPSIPAKSDLVFHVALRSVK